MKAEALSDSDISLISEYGVKGRKTKVSKKSVKGSVVSKDIFEEAERLIKKRYSDKLSNGYVIPHKEVKESDFDLAKKKGGLKVMKPIKMCVCDAEVSLGLPTLIQPCYSGTRMLLTVDRSRLVTHSESIKRLPFDKKLVKELRSLIKGNIWDVILSEDETHLTLVDIISPLNTFKTRCLETSKIEKNSSEELKEILKVAPVFQVLSISAFKTLVRKLKHSGYAAGIVRNPEGLYVYGHYSPDLKEVKFND